MKYVLVVLALLSLATGARAQMQVPALTSEREPVKISLQPTYQRYVDGEQRVEEWSMPLFAGFSLGRNLRVSLLAGVANASVKGGASRSISGLNDVQLSLRYTQRLGKGSLVFNTGVNVPAGKQTLTQEEFETMQYVSRDYYSFRVPSFGQGVSASPSLTWAVPLGDNLILGLGAAYQYRSGYTPREGMNVEYTPGNEVLATGGLDVRLSPNTALSGDVTYTLYGSDKMGDERVFEAGDKTMATVQLLSTLGFNELRFVGRYRTQAKSKLLGVNSAVPSEQETRPTLGLLLSSFRFRVSKSIYVTVQGQGRYFGDTQSVGGKTIGKVGLIPEVRPGRRFSFAPRVAYTFGDFSGWEGGLGLHLNV